MRDQIFGSAEHHHRASDWRTIVLVRSIHILVSTVPLSRLFDFEKDRRILDSSTHTISSILLKRLRNEPLPPSRFSLGKAAIPINAFALLYVCVTCVASFFPAVNSPSVADMNWSCAMFGGVLVIACVDYALRGRKHYIEPARHLNKMWSCGQI
jgi:hypothetical protein